MNTAEKLSPGFNPKALADVIEDQQIKREFSEDELQDFKAQLADNKIKVDKLQEQIKELKDKLADPIKAAQKEVNRCSKNIRQGYEINEVTAYGVANHETGFMEFFTEFGEKVSSRRLYPAERQLSIHSHSL